MKPKVIYFVSLLCCILLIGCPNYSNDSAFVDTRLYKTFNPTEIINELTQTPCGSIKIYPGVSFSNVTGKMTSRTKEGAIIYISTTRDLTLNNSLYAAENCFPVRRVQINDSLEFLIPNIPLGRYVAWLPSSEFTGQQGFPILNEFQDDKNELIVAFHGGNSKYSLVVFQIRARNFTDLEKFV